MYESLSCVNYFFYVIQKVILFDIFYIRILIVSNVRQDEKKIDVKILTN